MFPNPLNLMTLTLISCGIWGLLCAFSTFLMAGLAMLSSGLGFSHPNPGLLLGMFLGVACLTGMALNIVRYEVAWYLNWHWRRVRGVVHPDPYAPPLEACSVVDSDGLGPHYTGAGCRLRRLANALGPADSAQARGGSCRGRGNNGAIAVVGPGQAGFDSLVITVSNMTPDLR